MGTKPTPKMILWSKVMNLPRSHADGSRTDCPTLVIGDETIKDWILSVPLNTGENLTEEKAAHIVKCVNLHDEAVWLFERISLMIASASFSAPEVQLNCQNEIENLLARTKATP